MPNDVIADAASGTATQGQLVLAIGGLVGALGYLWRLIVKRQDKTETMLLERAQDCETKHEKTQETLLSMAAEVGKMQGTISALTSGALDRTTTNDNPRSGGVA